MRRLTAPCSAETGNLAMVPIVDYHGLAAGYDQRYAENEYPGIGAALAAFAEAGQIVLDVGEHITSDRSASEFLGRGASARRFTSQLILLRDEEYDAGVESIRTAAREAASRGQDPGLRAVLLIYATYGAVKG